MIVFSDINCQNLSSGDSERGCWENGQWKSTYPGCTGKKLTQISDLNGKTKQHIFSYVEQWSPE